MSKEIEMVMISKTEYDRLLDRDMFLDCLEACGVDNWEWYDDAIQDYDLKVVEAKAELCAKLEREAKAASEQVTPQT